MPGRKYSSASGYRYGFNGKENDNEVKGEGNQQDYGMRIYDPRLVRFLSVDPIANSYPWYTPYQFAGNDVMRCIDLDGLEPTMRVEKYVENYKPFVGGDWSIDVYDKANHRTFQASGIQDPNTGKTYIIADDGQGQNRYFYLVNDGGATDKIQWRIENGRNILVGGKFVEYETQNQIETKATNELCDATGEVVFFVAASVTVIESGAGMGALLKAKREIDKTNKKEQPTAKKDNATSPERIPDAARRVDNYAKNNKGAAQKGYKGGRKFENDGRGDGQILPKRTRDGKEITYREYDVHPTKKGSSRGRERVVRGSDGKSYYTKNHYKSFTEIKVE